MSIHSIHPTHTPTHHLAFRDVGEGRGNLRERGGVPRTTTTVAQTEQVMRAQRERWLFLFLLLLTVVSVLLFLSTPPDMIGTDENLEQQQQKKEKESESKYATTLQREETGLSGTVCIIGNSEWEEDGLRVWRMWNGSFPAVFWVWGRRAEQIPKTTVPPQVTFLREALLPPHKLATELSWKEGVYEAYEWARRSYSCEYYFLHDDDLYFGVRAGYEARGWDLNTPLNQILVELLSRWKPAVANFLWEVKVASNEIMQQHFLRWKGQEVAPLTGCDSGMMLLHHSIAELLFPFPPNGEGGITGHWTLTAQFFMHVLPTTLREHALLLLPLTYHNAKNLDNLPKEQRFESKRVGDLMFHSQSRHPYEYLKNQVYREFMDSAAWEPWAHRGLELTLQDVTWTPTVGNPPFQALFLHRLDEQYRLTHEMFRERFYPAWKKYFPNTPLHSTPTFVINVFGYNRPQSFVRLWSSLEAAEPIPYPINIQVFLDAGEDLEQQQALQQQRDLAFTLRSKHGPVRVHARHVHTGLKHNIMEAWNPRRADEYGIFLEDDLEVSPFFLKWAFQAVQTYYFAEHYERRLAGVSLYNIAFEEVHNRPFLERQEFTGMPYLLQHSVSWGALWDGYHWGRFQRWFRKQHEHGKEPWLPNSYTNRWSSGKSWKKYHLRFMGEEQLMTLMPNPGGNLSFSTNHVELGTNVKQSFSVVVARLNVPLVREQSEMAKCLWPPLHQLPVFDWQFRRVSNLEALPSPSSVTTFDGCTMIMTVFSRVATFQDRLRHFSKYPHLVSQIIIVWNNVEQAPPWEGNSLAFGLPVVIKRMAKNSMNNRFIPFPEILYDCVIHMDDDLDYPPEALDTQIHLWRSQFFWHRVSVTDMGRSHAVQAKTGELVYHSHRDKFVSITLPSGLILHRDFLTTYTYFTPKEALDLVDSITNCDDLLMNFVVANATGHPPVLVDIPVYSSTVWALAKTGTSSLPDHYTERHLCIRRFIELYGHMPLHYTNVRVSPGKTQRTPLPEEIYTFYQFMIMNEDTILSAPTNQKRPQLCAECVHFVLLSFHHGSFPRREAPNPLSCDMLQTPLLCGYPEKCQQAVQHIFKTCGPAGTCQYLGSSAAEACASFDLCPR
ncbi:EXTL3, alpha-1,4-N-acetylglucosaminyltransferase, glycosyltransferase family 64 protein [Balamuthia mandrillaris]